MLLTVVQRRNGIVESRHRVFVALVDNADTDVGVVDDNPITTFRSAAKPFQLLATLELLGDAAAWLEAEDLALGAASHHGEPLHVERAERLLTRFGARTSDLRCGVHWPANEKAAQMLVRQGEQPTPLHNNCSGKHAFMVGACRA